MALEPERADGSIVSDVRLASSVRATALVSGNVEDVPVLLELIQTALPVDAVLGGLSGTEMLARLDARSIDGRSVKMVIFDARSDRDGAVVTGISDIRAALPQAEIIIITQTVESPVVAACIRAARSPEQVTLLLAPFSREHIVETIRAVAARPDRFATPKLVEGEKALIAATAAYELQIQELKTRLDLAKHAGRHDDLTGILNRTGFVDELSTRLRRDHQKQAVLMIDLDRFKAVNDSLGHAAGDDLVRKISVGIASVIPKGEILARLGGDEFGVLVEGMSDKGLEDLCCQILGICSKSRLISGHEVQVSASIGVAHQRDTHSHSELMRQADLALYAAKREGRSRFRVFDQVLDQATRYRLSIENGLENALRSGQFKMVYQPIVTARSGDIIGFEALVRWDSPEHGMISPAEFIPIAEETGLILNIGEWIARQALRECRRWGGPYVSINLSARQFLQFNIADRILRYAAEADLPASSVQIELTETAIIDDVERAESNLRVLREAGVRVALDDFGTGYSSLVYLKQFSIDCIKIDKSFVDNVTTDRQSAMIVASVAKLAASLGMSVVAEGVETQEQRDVLIAAGCGALQGYLFGRPAAPEQARLLVGRREVMSGQLVADGGPAAAIR